MKHIYDKYIKALIEAKFTVYKELVENISCVREVEFSYNAKKYIVLSIFEGMVIIKNTMMPVKLYILTLLPLENIKQETND